MKVYLVSRKGKTLVTISTVNHQEAKGPAEILEVLPNMGDLHSSNCL
jgi:hypothetical protein